MKSAAKVVLFIALLGLGGCVSSKGPLVDFGEFSSDDSGAPNKKVEKLEKKIDKFDKEIDKFEKKIDKLEKRVKKLEKKLD